MESAVEGESLDQIFLRSPKVIRIILTFPSDSSSFNYDSLEFWLEYKADIGANHTLAFADAHLVYVGENLPCLDPSDWKNPDSGSLFFEDDDG